VIAAVPWITNQASQTINRPKKMAAKIFLKVILGFIPWERFLSIKKRAILTTKKVTKAIADSN
jgi:hypothetical protein